MPQDIHEKAVQIVKGDNVTLSKKIFRTLGFKRDGAIEEEIKAAARDTFKNEFLAAMSSQNVMSA